MQNNYFEDVAMCWLNSKKGNIKKTSYNRYLNTINIHLLPKFRNYKTDEITKDEIKSFIKEKFNNYEVNTIKSMLQTLNLILKFNGNNDAIIWRDLGIKRSKNEIDVLTEEESIVLNKNLLGSLSNKDIGIFLALNLGLRIGEICGLKWKDINMNKKSIHINCTMQRVKNDSKTGAKTRIELLAPKSESSKRELPIPDYLYTILKLKMEEANSNNSFLLTGKDEVFIEPRNLERYFDKKCLEILGRKIKFHNLRHTYASISLSNDVDSKVVSETLGHCSVYTTITFYQSVGFNDKYKAIQRLANVIGCQMS